MVEHSGTCQRSPSWLRRQIRPALRILLLLVVTAIGVVYRRQLVDAVMRLGHLGLSALLLLPLYWAWNQLAAAGWRGLIRANDPGRKLPSTWRLTLIRVESQAINIVAPIPALGGEVLRATLTASGRADLPRSTSAVVYDGLSSNAAGFIFVAVWLALGWGAAPSSPAPVPLAVALAVAVAAMLIAVPFVLGRWAERNRQRSGRIRAWLVACCGQPSPPVRRAYSRALLWHLAERVLTVLEVYIAARALGVSVSLTEGMWAGVWMTALSLIVFFVPSQLGAAEGALAAAFSALGHGATTGLAVALVRRARQLVVGVIGALVMVLFEGRRRSAAASTEDA